MRTCRTLVAAICLAAVPLRAEASSHGVSLRPETVSQGGVVRITVEGDDATELRAVLGGQSVLFFPIAAATHMALLGIDLEHKPGPVEVTIRGRGKDGRGWDRSLLLQVVEKAFPREELNLPPSFDRIDEVTRKRIEKEQAILSRLWSAATPRRIWEGAFLRPVEGGVTSPFGLRRVINGYPRSPHGGVDLKAALGAAVRAPNHGQVVLKDDFFFSGKSLVVDHGGGLYTMYYHLSEFTVGKDAVVRRGDLIGRAGMSGRVTGPHLHWGARLNGARVDPLELLEMGADGR
jgi:murein DD-endopeptidase MepM/ murein hydrolase activator NlpD